MARRRSTSGGAQAADGRESSYALQVNAYDRSSSILVALLIMVGATVAGLVIIYFTSRAITVQTAIPVVPINPPSAAKGIDDDTLPDAENVPEQLEMELVDTLDAIEGIVASQISLFDNNPDPNAKVGRGDPRADGGTGTGTGPPEPSREIRFEPGSLSEYAQWFDQMGFELGVLGRDNKVYYAKGVSKPKPELRNAPSEEEVRLYFFSGGPLAPLDRQLARKAGLLKHGTLILKFCSPATQQRLLSLEMQAAEGKGTEQIKRTVFRVEKNRGSYDFSVELIKLR